MNNLEKKQLGYKGEFLAKNYLESKGYTFLMQNFCVKGGEIDLIMKKNNILVFVEVKTKLTNTLSQNTQDMHERITPQKIRFLERSIQLYCLKNRYALYDTDIQIDAVYVLYKNDDEFFIEHEEKAVSFDDFV